jgi:Tfp pilus assembly pilus retraction ATPase PilT
MTRGMVTPIEAGQAREPFDLADALTQLVEVGGSDLCLKVGNSPLIRIDGKLG